MLVKPAVIFFPILSEAHVLLAERFLLIYCCFFFKRRQFSAINQTKFRQIIVKCKMGSQHPCFLKLNLHYIIPLESNSLRCPFLNRMHGAHSSSYFPCQHKWVSVVAILSRTEYTGSLYVLPAMTPLCCECHAYIKTSIMLREKCMCLLPI